MKRILLCTILLTIFFQGIAQSSLYQIKNKKREYKMQKIGDDISSYRLKNLINYPQKETLVSSFKGKLLILDFWSTGCASCVEFFPRMQALQEKFKGKIQIILANEFEKEQSIRELFERRRKLAGEQIRLPTICGDPILGMKMFWHKGDPHEVWIDSTGKVFSITGADKVNEKNIIAALQGKPNYMDQKYDSTLPFDFREPLFVRGNGGNGNNLIWYSVLSSKVPGLSATFTEDLWNKKGYSATLTNVTIRFLYRYAYSNRKTEHNDKYGLPLSLIELRLKDTANLVEKIDGEYQEQNKYCYQLRVPWTDEKKMMVAMQHDLDRFFGFDAHFEKQKIKCLVFSAEDTQLIGFKSGARDFDITDLNIRVNNCPMSHIISWLERDGYYYSTYPILDETDFHGNLGDISFEARINDPISLDAALQKYKMHFRVEERFVNILVISENKQGSAGIGQQSGR